MAGIVAKNDRTRLYIGPAAPGAAMINFLAEHKIGNMTTIGDISSTDEEVDVTTLEHDVRDFESGFPDNGSIEVTQNLTAGEYEKMATLKDNEVDIAVGLAIFNNSGAQVLGIQCAKAKIMTVTLGGMSVGGVLTVTTSIRIKSKFTRDFVAPGVIKLTSITISGSEMPSVANQDGELYTAGWLPVGGPVPTLSWSATDIDGEPTSNVTLTPSVPDGLTCNVKVTSMDTFKLIVTDGTITGEKIITPIA